MNATFWQLQVVVYYSWIYNNLRKDYYSSRSGISSLWQCLDSLFFITIPFTLRRCLAKSHNPIYYMLDDVIWSTLVLYYIWQYLGQLWSSYFLLNDTFWYQLLPYQISVSIILLFSQCGLMVDSAADFWIPPTLCFCTKCRNIWFNNIQYPVHGHFSNPTFFLLYDIFRPQQFLYRIS